MRARRIRARPARGSPGRTWRAKPGPPASRSIASASACASSGGTRSALTPARAISRHPGTSVATSGRPQAAASSSSTAVPRGGTAAPRYARMPRVPRYPRRSRDADIGRPGPGLDLLRRYRGRICRVGQAGDQQLDIAAALRQALVRGEQGANPLDSTSRPTKATVIAPGGSGEGIIASVSTPEPGISAMCRRSTPRRWIIASRRRSAPAPPSESDRSSRRKTCVKTARVTRSLGAIADEHRPEPGHGVETRRSAGRWRRAIRRPPPARRRDGRDRA